MEKKKSITNEKKMAALVSILPVMMDYMEDIKEIYPKVYSKRVKMFGNDFIKEVERNSDNLYRQIAGEDDKELMAFYQQINDLGVAFNDWLRNL
jgi:hypothetical protein